MTIPETLHIGFQHHQAGRLAEAEALYRQVLAVRPDHAGALHLLGLIAHQVGRHDLAVEWIRRAILLNPKDPFAHFNLGEAYCATRRSEEAIEAYRRALELKPDFPEAHHNLGAALAGRGQLDEAAVEYRHALKLRPDFPEAHNNLGTVLYNRDQPDEAIPAYHSALKLRPDYPEANYNLGNALKDFGRFDEAVTAYHRALESKPNFAEACNNLGSALLKLGEFDEAMAAYRRAIELKSDSPMAHNNLGVALMERGKLDESLGEFYRAIELKPDYPDAHNNLGAALKRRGQLDEAIVAMRRALGFKPGYACAHSNLIYTLHFHPDHDAMIISEEYQRWNRQFGDPLKRFILPHANDRGLERRLRIGYVSPDFRDHPVGRYVMPLFERHDRERFEILCYSGVLRPDWMTERLRTLAQGWRTTVGVSDARLAETICADGVDILVDLALHTADNRLPVFARHSAPVQVTWLGHAGSTGLPSIGYRLTDSHMDPPGEPPDWSAEEPIRLPDCWCCYDPLGESPEISALPAFLGQRVTFGSLNNFAKVNEGVLTLWAQILEAVKGSRLLMLCPEGSMRERVRAFFGARGIGEEGVELVGARPRWAYLELFHRIDLALDPFPFSGMTTTCDALWMGVPVLTMPGALPASRAGLSLLSNVGLSELVASSEEDYVRIAVELAGNIPRLAELRATLRARMQASPLMDAPRFARNVEAAYRSMWARWCRTPK
jgi:protein O-GlcNAc transferase